MLQIGWASCNITPDQPVLVTGQFYARVSESVLDPVTATVLALESDRDTGARSRVILVSCDLVAIPDNLRDSVRELVQRRLPALDPRDVVLNATHVHTGPEMRVDSDALQTVGGNVPTWVGVDLDVMAPPAYVAFVAERIADAIERAWTSRAPGGIGFGLGQAVVGHNRRITYFNGETRMYGKTDDPEFSHVEGYEDHSVNVIGVWDADRRLTGLVVNVACPSQVSEHLFQVSADYWHDTREELRRRYGNEIYILPQNSAAGDQSPHIQIGKRAEERMWRLTGRTQRQEIGTRIADAVTAILPYIAQEVEMDPLLAHRVDTVPLSRRLLTEEDVKEALAEADRLQVEYERMRRELDEHPEMREQPRWYKNITNTFRRMHWLRDVEKRFQRQQADPTLPVEIHIVRLGDVAIATNPFEYYLDFGMQIKARSKAIQTFLVQHVGGGTYLPTARAISGRSYGAIPASTPVGPEGGRELARWTVDAINAFWTE